MATDSLPRYTPSGRKVNSHQIGCVPGITYLWGCSTVFRNPTNASSSKIRLSKRLTSSPDSQLDCIFQNDNDFFQRRACSFSLRLGCSPLSPVTGKSEASVTGRGYDQRLNVLYPYPFIHLFHKNFKAD